MARKFSCKVQKSFQKTDLFEGHNFFFLKKLGIAN